MDEELRALLDETGDKIVDEHDTETIEAVIEAVEQLEEPDTDKTAALLRDMTGLDKR